MSRADNASKNRPQQTPADLPSGTLRILQITDTHIFGDPAGRLLGLNTLETLDQVLEKVRPLLGSLDLVLVTGDLVHDASAAGYARLEERLSTLGLPTYCIPGNHDESAALRTHLSGEQVGTSDALNHDGWLVVLLDSNKPGSEGGHLSEDELKKLESQLANHPDRHILVCLHHNPVPVGCPWLDPMQVDNAEEFFAVIDRHPQVRGIVWGHIHQPFEAERKGVRLIGSPSTCFQFEPQAKDFKLAATPPGCRRLYLLPSGEIRTDLIYADDMPANFDPNSTGY